MRALSIPNLCQQGGRTTNHENEQADDEALDGAGRRAASSPPGVPCIRDRACGGAKEEQRWWRLKERRDSQRLHGGSWAGWCEQLYSSNTGSGPSREALRDSARELVYTNPPGPHRRTFWGFCADLIDVDGGCGTPLCAILEAGVSSFSALGESQLGLIQLDVQRTRNLSTHQRAVLLRMLQAHCAYHRSQVRGVSGGTHMDQYVQGMHMLAACPLWAGLGEVEALAVFEFAFERLCAGYYADAQFTAFQRDVRVVEQLIAERLPRLARAFSVSGHPVMLLAFDPFLCLFTLHLPRNVVLRFWDVLLLEGEPAVFALFLALLEQCMPEAVGATVAQCNEEGNAESADSSFADLGLPVTEAYSFPQWLVEQCAELSALSAEAVLTRTRQFLEHHPSPTASCTSECNLWKRVQELRSATDPPNGEWYRRSGMSNFFSAGWMSHTGWMPQAGWMPYIPGFSGFFSKTEPVAKASVHRADPLPRRRRHSTPAAPRGKQERRPSYQSPPHSAGTSPTGAHSASAESYLTNWSLSG